MSMSTGFGKGVVLVAVIGLLVTPAVGAELGGLSQEQVAPDTVVLDVGLQENGDAEWAVIYRTRLDDDNTTEAFESLRDDIRSDPALYTSDFRDGMNRTVGAAENATGREMAIENLTVSAEVKTLPQEYGVVTYRFRWTNFARVEDGQIRAGDALAGLFLDSESTLQIHWPDGYERTDVAPTPDRSDTRQVAWDGKRNFGDDEPRVVATQGGAGTETSTTPAEPAGDGNAWILVVATILAIGGVATIFWANRRYGFTGRAATGAASGDGSAPTAAGSESGESRDETAEATDAAAAGAGAAGAATTDDGPPPELLSNEERVMTLLSDNGGRMKQQEVAEQLDWTAAKTSQVIGELRENDELETFRIGRENVVTLPDVDLASDVGDEATDGDE